MSLEEPEDALDGRITPSDLLPPGTVLPPWLPPTANQSLGEHRGAVEERRPLTYWPAFAHLPRTCCGVDKNRRHPVVGG
eukprot:CAMPEP_0197401038 /NCGR_PEP_ID=MMETSP1165-20131217/17826_1 /TAXON_ID=284809 /ORGANISM="Chrysocystis fragilis, Strain CCMP3189" /LENGTH=78 /DNA_ID=CAMNT_0042927135 /DNA_START=69 /DNA_END=301 /DNA_ORIENTATION=-